MNYNTTEKNISNRSLLDENFIFKLVIENMNDYVFVKDNKFRIVMCNPSFLEIYPRDYRDKIIGHTTIEKYTNEDKEAFLKKDIEAFKFGYSKAIESIAFPDGKVRVLETIKRRFSNKNGDNFILGVSRDVSEHYSMLDKIKKANQELNEFIRISSHDLRAPLNGIFQLVEWIEEDQNPPFKGEVEENFRLIKNRVSRMQNLLDDLLIYSKIGKANDIILKKSINQWINELVEFKGLSNKCKIKSKDKEIIFPRLAFDIIFGNLISNSIQHSNIDQACIEIKVETIENNYRITYKDNGPGIPTQHADVVFNILKTLNRRDSSESSGIGLSITKKAIERYNGSIILSKEINPSSEFVILFPILEVSDDR